MFNSPKEIPLPFYEANNSSIRTWLLRLRLRSEFHCCNLSRKWRNLEASVFKVALGSPIAMPSSPSSSSWSWLLRLGWWCPPSMLSRSWLFDLAKASPEEKLEQRFLILRHLRAKVPLPLLSKGVGAILIDLKNEIKKSLKISWLSALWWKTFKMSKRQLNCGEGEKIVVIAFKRGEGVNWIFCCTVWCFKTWIGMNR